MKNYNVNISILKTAPLFIFSLLTISCYKETVHINYKLHHGVCRNADNTKTAFILSKSAYLPPKGISRFPDGGIPTYLLEEVSLYLLNKTSGEIIKITAFNDLAKLIGVSRASWNTKIVFIDNNLYFKITPVSGWGLYKKNNNSKKVDTLIKKYSLPYRYNIKNKKITSTELSLFAKKYSNYKKADFSKINNLLDSVPLKKIGLDITELYPKPDSTYINQIIYYKNKSSIAQRAIIEQIIDKQEKRKIKIMIKKMNEYQKNLKGYKKKQYKRYYRKVTNKISKNY